MLLRGASVLLLTGLLSGAFPAAAAPADVPNRLYFSSRDNNLYYDTELFDEDRFMVHVDMSPGDTFRDELIIENGSRLPYDLYFQAVPVAQAEKSVELLEFIKMKIHIDGELLYEGKASGRNYTGVSLRDIIGVGRYCPNDASLMTVDLEFMPEYEPDETVWSRIDWKFWAVGEDSEEPIKPIPKTGDNGFVKILGALGVSAAALIIMAASRKRKRPQPVKL